MTLISRLHRWLSPAGAVQRLRILYYTALAALAVTLFTAHRLTTREHRATRLLSVASHVCQLQAELPVMFVRPTAARGQAVGKAKTNIRRAAAAEEK